MTTTPHDITAVQIGDNELWTLGPPNELFNRLRGECPIHYTREIAEFPGQGGFWSVTTARDVETVSRDWETYSSERGGVTIFADGIPPELTTSMFIGMDPPKHDRLRALFQRGFTPKRIADHEQSIRTTVTSVLGRLDGRDRCELVSDVAQPVASRVIGRFMGIPEEDDVTWARLINAVMTLRSSQELNAVLEHEVPELFQRCRTLIADRRERPTEDLTSVLVHAEVDGERLTEQEIVMGFFLLMAAGNDSTKATYCSAMRALLEDPFQKHLLLDEPGLIASAVEESLRMFPAFAHMRRTATRDTELNGQQISEGDKVVMWYVSANRDEARYADPDRFDVTRNPDHQAFGAGGPHYCMGAALARLEMRILLEETLTRHPDMTLDGEPIHTPATFVNQLSRLPVRLNG